MSKLKEFYVQPRYCDGLTGSVALLTGKNILLFVIFNKLVHQVCVLLLRTSLYRLFLDSIF